MGDAGKNQKLLDSVVAEIATITGQKPMMRRSDIYSFGVMLYEMFAGTLPWGGEAALAIKQSFAGA